MKALCWHGKHDVRVDRVPDPTIVNPRDAIVRVTLSAICGTDLHFYNHVATTLKRGDVLGHEFMGEVVDIGHDVKNLRRGDRVVVSAIISCGSCLFCQHGFWSQCDNSNPKPEMAEMMYGHSPGAPFGHPHMYGAFGGGQAEYIRVPYADVGCVKPPESLTDEQALFVGDIFSTGFMAAENADIQPGGVVAVWGCGPVGQFAIKSAFLLGADKVIAIDRVPERLEMARRGGAEVINYTLVDSVVEELQALTGGRGPDSCIDCVGLEAHSNSMDFHYDHAKQRAAKMTDRISVVRQAIMACRKAGTISIAGVYMTYADKLPMGAAFNKALTFRGGPTHMHRYMRPLLERIEKGEVDPTSVITHRMRLEDAPHGYDIFNRKVDNCIKVVLRP